MAKSIQAGDWSTTLGAIAGGMSPDYWDSKTGGTLLWKAIEENNQDVAKKLIKFGADIEIKAENGKTALMLAVELVRFDCYSSLCMCLHMWHTSCDEAFVFFCFLPVMCSMTI